MSSEKWVSALLLLQLCCFSCGSCGKVLAWPMEFSHWMNMKTILDELVQRGHEVTVLIPSAAVAIDAGDSSGFHVEVFPVETTQADLASVFENWITLWSNELQKLSALEYGAAVQKVFSEYSVMVKQHCESAVLNKDLMKTLKDAKYEVVIADPVCPCAELVAEILGIPFVYSLRFTVGNTIEKYCGGLPSPPSYVPVPMTALTDKMTFMERVKNMLFFIYSDFWFQNFDGKTWDQFYSDILGRPTTLCETMGKAEMWLIRTYWDFEFPRPYLPNFEFVGGLHCKPAKPLPEEMEKFVQSSGEHGVVVFSLGSMVKNLTEEKSNLIAAALAQIPQKVLWRYEGKPPATLGSNTRTYNWIPQNDLLGHPKTKAFITHGGTNGIYEAIYHGVPMIGVPMFADQPDNIAHMKAKGAAVEVDFHKMTTADMLNALKTVINDPSYKENAMRLSRIHHDQPVKPLDRAVFWIEFVMRHKGAKHLRPAAHDLTWYQYHSLDVIGFLLACVATVVFIVVKSCLFCFRKLGKTGKKQKRA
ncbi:UDP-glucuronosyltransferase 2B17-like isoform X14 [Trichosurus vulpecula]|uniref:UDP-glucuronosyltransferase 2B17-like isoform X14 n=1 Tax=Trichosurus vulpecula TaxID=9337 RepID=UPI00186AF8AF|nr:UDP-glucuronosyltransferase 2B17-like isoform X14 [Trichosurus vulpecula]